MLSIQAIAFYRHFSTKCSCKGRLRNFVSSSVDLLKSGQKSAKDPRRKDGCCFLTNRRLIIGAGSGAKLEFRDVGVVDTGIMPHPCYLNTNVKYQADKQ